MYFGSVRFFKHLIISLMFLVITGLLTATIVLAVGNGDKNREIEKLNLDKNALQTLYEFGSGKLSYTVEEICLILEGLGINNKELVNALYEGDKEAFNDILAVYALTGITDITDAVTGGTSQNNSQTTATRPELSVETDAPAFEANGIFTDSSPETGDSANPYADLYPHLYAEPMKKQEYIDDTGYIYLTFDDGPSKSTENILMYLNNYGIKATFFVMPDDTEKSKEYLNTMLETGHEIGIHSMTHKYDVIYKSVEAFLDDFNQAYNLVFEQTGYKPYLFRFPGGSVNDYNVKVRGDIIAEMTRRGFVYFDWNVDSRDAMDATWTQMYNSVLNDVADLNRAIVLFHDRPGGENTVYVLEDIIKALINDPKRYTFSKITQQTRPIQF